MKTCFLRLPHVAATGLVLSAWLLTAHAVAAGYLSPAALAVAPDGSRLYVTAATANAILQVDAGTGEVQRRINLPAPPTGLALNRAGDQLFVTCARPQGILCMVDTTSGEVARRTPLAHTPVAPVLSPDGLHLYVCSRFRSRVMVVETATGKVVSRIPVEREPISAAVTPDGKHLLVAHHLPSGAASANRVAANVSVIDLAEGRVVKSLMLPNGSTTLRDIRVSPDGRLAAVVHTLARYQLPTTQLERGWMNTSAVTLIDVPTLEVINSVLLDSVDYGAANPWGVAWTADSSRLLVTHAGTRELSLIDIPGLLEKLARLPKERPTDRTPTYISASASVADVPNDLAFLVNLRERIKLPGIGPRAVAMVANRAFIAEHFSDTLDVLDLDQQPLRPKTLALGPAPELTAERWGEQLFNDATICFQQWQSCASCHSEDARIDGLNWDLMNDDLGNPKNSKSLLLALATPPAMSLGVRDSGEAAVRAGIRHILLPCVLKPRPKPWTPISRVCNPCPALIWSGAVIRRGRARREVFNDELVGCAFCHPAESHFTDMKSHDVGTQGLLDREQKEFDTPTLVEVWRTGPYLHDGSAAALRDVLVGRNLEDQHGQVSDLSPSELEDLLAYVSSL
ncbi:MAG: cell surface protein [Verrucomicrobiales bacterium]|nr:cell surface protein [Verrucomicrobiales bacterium]